MEKLITYAFIILFSVLGLVWLLWEYSVKITLWQIALSLFILILLFIIYYLSSSHLKREILVDSMEITEKYAKKNWFESTGEHLHTEFSQLRNFGDDEYVAFIFKKVSGLKINNYVLMTVKISNRIIGISMKTDKIELSSFEKLSLEQKVKKLWVLHHEYFVGSPSKSLTAENDIRAIRSRQRRSRFYFHSSDRTPKIPPSMKDELSETLEEENE